MKAANPRCPIKALAIPTMQTGHNVISRTRSLYLDLAHKNGA